jgi:hypothetical protein
MSTEKLMKPEEIINLLSKLKDETPGYPAEMLAGRKAAFLKQAVNIKIDGKGQGGEGGQQGGGSSAVSGGGAASPGVFLQALVGISIVAAMLSSAYMFRDQIVNVLQETEVVAQQESSQSSQQDASQPPIASTPFAPQTTPAIPGLSAPVFADPPSEIVGTETPEELDNTNLTGDLVVNETQAVEITSGKTKSNNGLHLGQTPGTPAAPGQGNPGNPNQPEKPAKTEKPPKTEKTQKPKPNK